MKRIISLFASLLLFSPFGLFACHFSTVSNSSMTQVGNQWRLIFQLDIGRGVNGTSLGANDDTRTMSFGFYGGNSLLSFSPMNITGTQTACTMPGLNLGPIAAPYNTQSNLLFMDPGYYGYAPCASTPFACVTSTALCGNIGVESNVFTLFFDCLPDSMRVFGVEGAGNPLAGCYSDTDMMLDFTSLTSSISCPGRQTVAADSSCQGFLPDVVALASGPCQVSGYTQTPAIGTLIGGLGDSTLVYIHETGFPPSSATCSLYVRVVDSTGPMLQCPPNQTTFVDNNCQFTVSNFSSMAIVADNCDPSPSITGQMPASGTVLANNTIVQLTATDNAGNLDTCAFSLTGSDTIAPLLTCPGPQQLYLNANCFASLFDYTSLANAQDNCASSVSLSQSPGVGTAFQGPGVSTITILGTDGSNNTTTCTFQVTRVDSVSPIITCPAAQTVVLNSNCEAVLADLTLSANANDNCANSIQLGQNPAAGTLFSGPSSVQVTLSATDSSSNTGSCTLTMTFVAGALTDTIMASTLTPCQGDTVTLDVTAGLGSYVWSTGDTSNLIHVSAAGWYWCDVNLSSSCGARDSIFVDFLPVPQPSITIHSIDDICVDSFSTYQWFRDNVLIVGETSRCISFPGPGVYHCVVTDSNGCEGSSAPYLHVGIEKAVSNSYSIYPVPTKDVLHLKFEQPISKPGAILLYDLAGRLVYQQAFAKLGMEHTISLDGLARGDYLLEVKTANFSGARKVLKLD